MKKKRKFGKCCSYIIPISYRNGCLQINNKLLFRSIFRYIFLVGFILLILTLIIVVITKIPFIEISSKPNEIGDTLGGILTPILTLASLFVLYYAFTAQIKANKEIMKSNELLFNSNQFEKLTTLNTLIESRFDFIEKQFKNDSLKNFINLIYKIVREKKNNDFINEMNNILNNDELKQEHNQYYIQLKLTNNLFETIEKNSVFFEQSELNNLLTDFHILLKNKYLNELAIFKYTTFYYLFLFSLIYKFPDKDILIKKLETIFDKKDIPYFINDVKIIKIKVLAYFNDLKGEKLDIFIKTSESFISENFIYTYFKELEKAKKNHETLK